MSLSKEKKNGKAAEKALGQIQIIKIVLFGCLNQAVALRQRETIYTLQPTIFLSATNKSSEELKTASQKAPPITLLRVN